MASIFIIKLHLCELRLPELTSPQYSVYIWNASLNSYCPTPVRSMYRLYELIFLPRYYLQISVQFNFTFVFERVTTFSYSVYPSLYEPLSVYRLLYELSLFVRTTLVRTFSQTIAYSEIVHVRVFCLS